MRYISIIILLTLLIAGAVQAQDTTVAAKSAIRHWSWRGFFQLNFNQIALANWVAGGENSIAGTTLTHYDFNYKNDDSTTRWENSIDLGYGLTRLAESGVRKNDDRIDLNTKYSKKATGKFNYSAIASFKSQFAPGYKYPNDSVVISKFMAPGYIIVSIGIDYRPTEYLSIYLSPATGKGTFVMDPALSDAGAFGVDKAIVDEDGNKLRSGSRFRPEFGASLEARFKKDIMQNVNVQSRLNLFNNYTDKNLANRKNIDLNWETAVNMKVNQYIAASLIIHLIYDDDIDIPVTRTVDGVQVNTTSGPKLQFKQALGVGFSYKFGRG
jgi:hypothetical protein